MTQPDRLELLRMKCEETSQAGVARRLGLSATTVNQILKGNYGGDPGNVLARVEEIFGCTTVECPVLEEISLKRCSENKKKPLMATSPLSVKLWRACKECRGGRP